MANRTAWTGGNLNSGLGYTATLTTGGVATLASGNSILDGTDITNGTGLDMIADISFSATISSSAVAAGAAVVFWQYPLNQDASTYGDNQLSTTAGAVTPVVPGLLGPYTIPLFASTRTALVGTFAGIQLVPGTFRWAMQNLCGFTFTACTVKFRSYNIQNNN